MESLERLCEMLYREIDEIAQKPNLSTGDLDTVHKLTDTVKNIAKIEMLEGGGQSHSSYGPDSYSAYSRAGEGEWEARGEYSRRRYSRDGASGAAGMSGASYGRHYVRGHYSRDDVKNHMIEQLEGMMAKADSEESRKALEKCMMTLENS